MQFTVVGTRLKFYSKFLICSQQDHLLVTGMYTSILLITNVIDLLYPHALFVLPSPPFSSPSFSPPPPPPQPPQPPQPLHPTPAFPTHSFSPHPPHPHWATLLTHPLPALHLPPNPCPSLPIPLLLSPTPLHTTNLPLPFPTTNDISAKIRGIVWRIESDEKKHGTGRRRISFSWALILHAIRARAFQYIE